MVALNLQGRHEITRVARRTQPRRRREESRAQPAYKASLFRGPVVQVELGGRVLERAVLPRPVVPLEVFAQQAVQALVEVRVDVIHLELVAAAPLVSGNGKAQQTG